MTRITGPILLSGYAKLPSNTTAQKLFDQLVVVASVDYSSGIVLDVDCTMATELGRRFVIDTLKGYDLNRGPNALLETVQLHYFGHLKKALLTALKEIFDHYADMKRSV